MPRRLPATARRPDWFRSFPAGGRTQARQAVGEPSEEGRAAAEAVAVVEHQAAVEAEAGPVAAEAAGGPVEVEAEAAAVAAAWGP